MSYNLRYTGSFDVQQSAEPFLSIKVDIYKKNYVGSTQTIILTGTPIVHEWQDDDPFAPIKGSTCKIGIINDGSISLNDFYSDADNTFGIEVKRVETGEVLFAGYILQDDCREIQVDFAHEIFLTATDNLGLIKDVTLNDAAKKYGTNTAYNITISTILGGYTFYSPDSVVGNIQIGQQITVSGGPYNGIYTVLNISYDPILFWEIYVAEPLPNSGSWTGPVYWAEPIDLSGYISLLSILRLCFKATQLENIPFSCVSTLKPSTYFRWLDDTYVRAYTFKNKDSDSWMSCYDVLEQIMIRFKASAFQAYGRWWVVRWGELYFQSADITTMGMKGTIYNTDFQIPTTTTFGGYSFSLLQGDIEYGIEKSIVRPIRYDSEQFNYKMTTDIFKNIDLTEVGDLINQYTDGGNIVKEYVLLYWELNTATSPSASTNLTIIYDSNNEVVDRYIKLNGPCFSIDTIKGPGIELTAGDRIKYGFDVKTIGFSNLGLIARYRLEITDGFNTYHYNTNDSTWTTGATSLLGDVQAHNFGDSAEWTNMTFETSAVPIDGILNIYIGPPISGGSYPYDAAFKNFTFDIIYEIGGSRFTTGHIHKNTNTLQVKNINEKEIFLDNTRRSTIAGTLFTPDSVNDIRIRTTNWQYDDTLSGEYGVIGYLTTLEQMMINYTARSRYDGSILKIWQGSEDNIRFISNFFVFNVLNSADSRRFVPGNLSIDYKHNRADITLHQLTNYEETPADVNDFYTFNYIYENG